MAAQIRNLLSPAHLAQMPLCYKSRNEAINALVTQLLSQAADRIRADLPLCAKLSKMNMTPEESAALNTYKILEEATTALKPYAFTSDSSWCCFTSFFRTLI